MFKPGCNRFTSFQVRGFDNLSGVFSHALFERLNLFPEKVEFYLEFLHNSISISLISCSTDSTKLFPTFVDRTCNPSFNEVLTSTDCSVISTILIRKEKQHSKEKVLTKAQIIAKMPNLEQISSIWGLSASKSACIAARAFCAPLTLSRPALALSSSSWASKGDCVSMLWSS